MPGRTPHRTNKTNRTYSSQAEGFTPAHGGYEDLLSFQKARIVFDGTVRFCDRFVASAPAPGTRWCRPLAPANRTSSKAARLAAPPRKSNSSSPTSPAPASKNFSKTTATSCAPAATLSGPRTQKRPSTSESSVQNQIGPMSPIGLISKLAHRRSSPISSSASFTRLTTCSTSNSGGSSRIFSPRAASANA